MARLKKLKAMEDDEATGEDSGNAKVSRGPTKNDMEIRRLKQEALSK